MTKPSFLCVGAAKAGTTSIQDVVIKHSQVFLPIEKELHFFDDPDNFEKGLSWYESFYEKASDGQLCGEITPAYMTYPDMPQRAVDLLGSDLKIIMLLRHPVARAFSEYLHNYRRGYLGDMTFEEAIDKDLNSQSVELYEKRKYSFVSRGYYGQQVENFLKVLPRDQLLILSFENDLVAAPKLTYERIQDFLKIEIEDLDYTTKSNESFQPKNMKVQKMIHGGGALQILARRLVPGKPLRRKFREWVEGLNSTKGQQVINITQYTKRELLVKYYSEDIKKLEDLSGMSFEYWRK